MVGPVVVSGPVAPFLFISNFFPFFFPGKFTCFGFMAWKLRQFNENNCPLYSSSC